jgi:membrane associated rhomboid family serine protease
MVRGYRGLGQRKTGSWNPGLVALSALGLSFPFWAWLLLRLLPGHENPWALAQWTAIGTGVIAWLVAWPLYRRRVGADEERLERRIGEWRPSLRSLARSPSFWLVLGCVTVWLYSITTPEAVLSLGWRPAECCRGERLWTLLTSTFAHTGISHLGWNVLWLALIAAPVEKQMSWPAYVGLFLLGAVAGKLAHGLLADPATVMVGMSGAVMAIMGAHLAVSPWRRYHLPYAGTPLPALITLPAYALLMVLGDAVARGSSVWAAHLGGFVAGLLIGLGLRAVRLARVAPEPPSASLV